MNDSSDDDRPRHAAGPWGGIHSIISADRQHLRSEKREFIRDPARTTGRQLPKNAFAIFFALKSPIKSSRVPNFRIGIAREVLAMDDLLGLRLLGGGFGGGIDLTALIAFLAFAVFYLIVPLLGYGPERPAALV